MMSSPTLDLFDADLSLFGGDLLDYNLGGSECDHSSAALVDSGGACGDLLDFYCIKVSQQVIADQPAIPQSPTQGMGLSNEWMDTKLDLEDILDPIVPVCPAPTDPTTIVNDVLNVVSMDELTYNQDVTQLAILADELSSLLDCTPESSLDIVEPIEPSMDYGRNIDILNLLASCNDIDAIDLDPMSPQALSEISSEDVEDCLLSGPPSPEYISVTPSPVHYNTVSISDIYNSPNSLHETPVTYKQSIMKQLLLASPPPAVPYSPVTSDDDGDSSSDYVVSDAPPRKGRRRTAKLVAPYTKQNKQGRIQDRKLRKKQQNKEAATRYREKKRSEGEEIDKEFKGLDDRNKELHSKVDEMTREIQYLKDLLAEVYEAKSKRN